MKITAYEIGLLLIYATLTATGNIFLARAALRIASENSILVSIVGASTSVYLWLGLALYGVSFLLWLWLLSFIPLVYAYPISAVSLAIAPLLGGLISHQFPGPLYWVGLTIVIFGLSVIVRN
jgi:drug/metabolite transporter (DMT)-like permease